MSRRRGVKQSCFLLFSSALFLLLSLQHTSADGNIGCLYSSEQCDPKTEWCYDDNAFGRCVFKFGFVSNDLYRYQFKYDDLEKLKEELEQLRELGYSWQHEYTQCIVQNQLNSVKFGLPYNGEICEQVLKKEPADPVRVLQYEQGLALYKNQKNRQFLGSSNEGIVKFEPDDGVETRRFAGRNDYLGSQPDYENELINQLRLQSNLKPDVYKKNMKSTSSRYRGTPLYVPIHNRDKFKTDENDLSAGDEIFNENANDMNWDIRPNEKQEVYDNIFNLQKALNVINREKVKAYTEGGSMYISDKKNDYEDSMYDKIFDQYGSDIFGFQRSERLDVKKPGPYFKVNNYAFGNMNAQKQEGENKQEYEDDDESKIKISHRNVERSSKELNPEYEYVPNYLNRGHSPISYPYRSDNSSYVTIETNNGLTTSSMVSQFIGSLTKLHNVPPGVFKPFKVVGNRITLFVGPNILNYSAADVKRLIESDIKDNLNIGIDIKQIYIGQPNDNSNDRTNKTYNMDSDKYAIVDADFVYIQLKNKLKNWPQIDNIIKEIATLLKLPREAFKEIKSGVSDIAFKIGPNKQNLTASEVAGKIDTIKDELENKLHIDITSVVIGDKDKFPVADPVKERDTRLYMLTFIVCGVIGAVLVSSIALYFIKKQARLKDKLLIPREKELGKDYQELCRNRMATKSAQEGSASGQRITSLSRESDNSPSSRSSTSSWSEEPMTNMDITTGHMVLAYMEDHLTNKARLDTEWAALCAYDADPCSVAIAQLPENIRKNRYVNALPYDHARVFLNALSNVNGSDYINASTITDHDPRNPAYIASQGPLENTVCDFWQMIWEQGCVVIVMLTRLVENDTSMCQRYWPLEGAELYNIYEVHLVSEHIWCDDFLVRSFYLKNLKTTETRTVTQFHFLTWPEGGIPSATKPLLEFRRKVNKSFRGRSCPIVVHCSDGVGRTGSYLLLDMVLNRISKGAKEIDIAATLEHIRDQRAGAVCTKQQFQFVLSAVAEEVQAVLRALPQQQSTTQEQGPDSGLPAGQQASGGQRESVATTSTVPTGTNGSQAQGQVTGGEPPRKQSK